VKSLEFRPAALDQLRSLEPEDRRRIGYALHQLVTTGVGDVKAPA
jgi:phage-related protein